MIRFPQKHIADSVAERIMQAQQQMRQQHVDSVTAQGQKIEQALQQPVGDVGSVEGLESELLLKVLGL